MKYAELTHGTLKNKDGSALELSIVAENVLAVVKSPTLGVTNIIGTSGGMLPAKESPEVVKKLIADAIRSNKGEVNGVQRKK